MTRLLPLLLLCALLAACTDAPRPPATWAAPVPTSAMRAVMASPTPPATGTPLPGPDLAATAAYADAILRQVAGTERAQASAAAATEAGYAAGMRATADYLAVRQAEMALAGTASAGTATADALRLAQDRERSAAIGTAYAAQTAAQVDATRTARALAGEAEAAGYARTGAGLRELGTGAGVVLLCAGLPVLALTAAFAALAAWRQCQNLDTSSGVPLRCVGGLWERVPEEEAREPEPEARQEPPVPPEYRDWMLARRGGRVVAAYPPVAEPADADDRRLALALLEAGIELAGPDSQTLPGWRKLGWSPETWSRARLLLAPYLDARPGKGTLLTAHADLYALREAVRGGLHLATTPAPPCGPTEADARTGAAA